MNSICYGSIRLNFDSFPLARDADYTFPCGWLIGFWFMGVSILSAWSAVGWDRWAASEMAGYSSHFATLAQKNAAMAWRLGPTRAVRLCESAIAEVPR
jgi:hypothetical protein